MFAEILKTLRKGKSLSQVEFAQAFNISKGTIAMWETGKRQPDYDTLQKLADFFSVSVDYLLGREDEKKEPESMNASELNDRIFNVLRDLPEEKKEDVLNYLEFLRAKSQGS